MIHRDKAIELLLSDMPDSKVISVKLEESLRYVLAQDLISTVTMPPFNKSSMDGYAIISQDSAHVPVRLKIIDEIPAGKMPSRDLAPNTCSKIMTGAPLPKNADAVAILERVQLQGDSIVVSNTHAQWENVCIQGEDIKAGDIALGKNTEIRPQDVSVLATCGVTDVQVFAMPGVSVLATGDELVEPHENPGPAKIRNSNAYQTIAQLKKMGISAKYLGIARDDEEDLGRKLKSGLDSDVLIISGGVSKGEYDLVISSLNKLGVEYVFHQVNVKPGKPFFYGKKNFKRIFGLPGNPVSSFVTFEIFVKPCLEKIMGQVSKNFEKTVLGWDIKKPNERFQYLPARLRQGEQYKEAEKIRFNGSGDLFAISNANALVVIHPNTTPQKGTIVDTILI